jgi:hypothetical protein
MDLPRFQMKKPPNFVGGLLKIFVIRIGFEPMACCLEGSCSIQLSYRTGAAKVENVWQLKN